MGLGEGEFDEMADGIEYSGVDSCLTITCLLADGKHVGGHLSLVKKPGKLGSADVLPAMKDKIAGRTVRKVHAAGALRMWNSQYFSNPLWLGEGEAAYKNPHYTADLEYDSVGPMAGWHLGLADQEEDAEYTSEDRTGDFTVALGP